MGSCANSGGNVRHLKRRTGGSTASFPWTFIYPVVRRDRMRSLEGLLLLRGPGWDRNKRPIELGRGPTISQARPASPMYAGQKKNAQTADDRLRRPADYKEQRVTNAQRYTKGKFAITFGDAVLGVPKHAGQNSHGVDIRRAVPRRGAFPEKADRTSVPERCTI